MCNFAAVNHQIMAISGKASVSGPLHQSLQMCWGWDEWCPPWGGDANQQARVWQGTLQESRVRSLHYECLQTSPVWCFKQLRADVEPMIIFWVGLGSSTLAQLVVWWDSLYLAWPVCILIAAQLITCPVNMERCCQAFQKQAYLLFDIWGPSSV